MRRFISKVGLIFLLSLIFLTSYSYADKGVFNAKVTPNETLTNTSTTIKISAEVGSENLYISSVRAYQTTESGQPISLIGQMYDDGTHGDEIPADTIFSIEFNVNNPIETNLYYVVTAAYSRDRNRYISPVLEFKFFEPVPEGAPEEMVVITKEIEETFYSNLSTMGIEDALQSALEQATNDPRVESAILKDFTLSIVSVNGVRGIIVLSDPSTPSDGPGNSVPQNLPQDYESPGNDNVLIFAPGYDDADRQNQIADEALQKFSNSEYMSFNPDPLGITKATNASLEVIKRWGNYGAVIIHTHGNVWTNPTTNNDEVILRSGTLVNAANDVTYALDLADDRLGVSTSGKYVIFPSFIDTHSNNMVNTFFYLGACNSLENDTLWNSLQAKGAKVALGWSDTVDRSFNTAKFKELTDSMLPSNSNDDPLTVSQAFDDIDDKVDGWCPWGLFCLGGEGATLTLKTASANWGNYLFYEGGLVNGDFETGDWTGWTHGGENGQVWQLVLSARVQEGNFAGSLGRWDTAYHGYDPTSEPYGYEWFYQDFVVPNNITKLKFHWWMETYDTAVWDWFDAYIKDTNGNTLITILSHAGKPGTNYGPYWSTQMADGGDGWREVTVDISAYQGQEIRIYFDQRLDGWGDQQRVYVDNVILE